MAIQMYVQGSNTSSDHRLFGTIGSWLTSKAIHNHLGMPINSDTGDFWWVDIDDQGFVLGFSTGRRLKNGALHLRYLFCAEGNSGSCHALAQAAVQHAMDTGCKRIWTNDRAGGGPWKRLKFTFTPSKRGQFGRWEREIKK
jgi:hypothetical protein